MVTGREYEGSLSGDSNILFLDLGSGFRSVYFAVGRRTKYL